MRHFGRGLLNLALPPRCLRCDDDLSPTAEISLCLKCTQAIAPELGDCCDRCGAVLPEELRPGRTLPGMQGFFTEIRRRLSAGSLSRGLAGTGAEDETPLRGSPFACRRPAAGPAVGGKTGQYSAPMPCCRSPCIGPNGCSAASTVRSFWPTAWEESWGCRWCAALVRCRYTGPQKDLLPRERFRNVRGAFRLRRSGPATMAGLAFIAGR